MKLRIADWDRNFENSTSRKLKRLDWVAIPNKTDGEGYTALVDHPNAAAHLGAWYAIVEAASKQTPRGYLPGGIPHSIGGIARSLGRMSRLPAKVFEEVLPRLLEIGWVEDEHLLNHQKDNKILGESADVVGESADVVGDDGRKVAAHRQTHRQTHRQGTELQDQTDAKVPHGEFPEVGRAVREKFPEASDVVIMQITMAVGQKCAGANGKLKSEPTDILMAEAVRHCAKAWPAQNSPHGYTKTVPQCVLTWLTNGKPAKGQTGNPIFRMADYGIPS